MKKTTIYAENLDGAAYAQFASAMSMDYAVEGALMPDTHKGYTLPIGAVVAADGVVVPSWVGYDIGCGMAAAKINLKQSDLLSFEEEIAEKIYEKIPVGNKKHMSDRQYDLMGLTPEGQTLACDRGALSQIGTLGGGNHFIEIGHDEVGDVWIVCHSGSRGTGHGIAGHYMDIAAAMNDKKEREGHNALPVNTPAGQAYINDLNWCLEYAINNRKKMIHKVMQAIEEVSGKKTTQCEFINRNHNHAELRPSDGLWIHRKGATHAEEGMMGVIPGNMRDGSFIVRGKGNPDSLQSSSHGAGRVLGRYKAKKVLSVDDFAETMEGIVAKVGHGTLDESPMAYKNIFEVMRLQEDLVEVVAHVTPIINIKG